VRTARLRRVCCPGRKRWFCSGGSVGSVSGESSVEWVCSQEEGFGVPPTMESSGEPQPGTVFTEINNSFVFAHCTFCSLTGSSGFCYVCFSRLLGSLPCQSCLR
jgi:hypothetical protein